MGKVACDIWEKWVAVGGEIKRPGCAGASRGVGGCARAHSAGRKRWRGSPSGRESPRRFACAGSTWCHCRSRRPPPSQVAHARSLRKKKKRPPVYWWSGSTRRERGRGFESRCSMTPPQKGHGGRTRVWHMAQNAVWHVHTECGVECAQNQVWHTRTVKCDMCAECGVTNCGGGRIGCM